MKHRHYAGFRMGPPTPRKRDQIKPPAKLTDPELFIYAAEVIERAARAAHLEYCGPVKCICRARGRLRLAAQLRDRARNSLHPKKKRVRFSECLQLVAPLSLLQMLGRGRSSESSSGV